MQNRKVPARHWGLNRRRRKFLISSRRRFPGSPFLRFRFQSSPSLRFFLLPSVPVSFLPMRCHKRRIKLQRPLFFDPPSDKLHPLPGAEDASVSHFVILFARPQSRSWFTNDPSIHGSPLRYRSLAQYLSVGSWIETHQQFFSFT